VEDIYYYGIMKECKNCAWRNKNWIIFSKCNHYPTYVTVDAIEVYKLREWQPSQELYNIMLTKKLKD